MNARRLLEQAAAAVDFDYNPTVTVDWPTLWGSYKDAKSMELTPWNPLEDAGTALELLARLGEKYGARITVTANGCCSAELFAGPYEDQFEEDAKHPLAALCKVIVMQAAAVKNAQEGANSHDHTST